MEVKQNENSLSAKDRTDRNNDKFFTKSLNINLINEKFEIKIIENISDLLCHICNENTNKYNKDNKNKNKTKLEKHFLSINPSISVKGYLERLFKYTKVSSSTIVMILIYIDRLCNINKLKLTYSIIHKLILSSMVVAIKYNEDEYYPMKFYAKLGGISLTELNFLEFYFISLINFNLFIKKELFDKYNDYISSAGNEETESEDENYYEISDDNNTNEYNEK
jgi:hypothetical protein